MQFDFTVRSGRKWTIIIIIIIISYALYVRVTLCVQCDIGLIYDEPRHALINKWLLLSNPSEASEGVKGFLKICAAVIGPNDDAPVHTAASRSGSGSIYIYTALFTRMYTGREHKYKQ